jgi:nicotinamidase/pyrazinamidase
MRALIVVDVQNDFMPSGALPVPRADEVLPVINELVRAFPLVVATQDWHPGDHGSFAANQPGHHPGEVIELGGLPQILWPVHCVQGTFGAEFVQGLDVSRFAAVFRNGTESGLDSYSGFFDNGHRKETGLGAWLSRQGVDEVYVAGVATEYCVKFTALDAVALGFPTRLVRDACRGIDLSPGDVDRAVADLRAKGVQITTSSALRG